MTKNELLILMEALAPAIHEATHASITKRLKPLEEKLAAAEHRLNQQELAPLKSFADFYKGVFQRELAYQRGDLVTSHGSLFMASKATSEVPGVGSDWRLIVKAGRPGKDAT